MDQRIINLFDEYTHVPLTRKEFMERLVKLTGGTALAAAALAVLEPGYAKAATIATDDNDLVTEEVTWPGDAGVTMKGYLVHPKGKKKRGAVVVIHENRGLTPHIKDVTRRVAKAGYLALGVDALSVFGGTPANEDEGRALIGKLDKQQNLNNYLAALAYLRQRPDSNGKTGCVGFCWGGAMANSLATHDPKLNAAVAYYGTQPAAEEVPNIKAALMMHYAGLDERVNAGMVAYEAALKAAGVKYEQFVYPGVNHAFNNDSSPARYNAEAAKLAWDRTLKLFKSTLS
ncbi:dienelactone hydrolase family protein [Hymenobacter taeanensis]|uniref:Dienelactone hydrolase family protein n=1 Tax=Hymenobacter taeanensis TaxID=2735321 RepID=A0A6M6BKQ4_9BACT|nr:MULTISPECIES: dienelactone hydrolase family protein [Hymenobacter]QJX47635.1 dienelactone hydrolase family protein [Hymenobacter taeanensis]UOQ82882.1 dienelactone hydrolase family protein [Hymenobacter sp. 5414T-23]